MCAGKSRGSARLNRSKSLVSEARESKLLIGRFPGEHEPRYELANSRAVLEAVPRYAADEPGVCRLRMVVGDEVLVGSLFVLTHAYSSLGRAPTTSETIGDVW